jgi:pyruvate formate lyase activating enzyme
LSEPLPESTDRRDGSPGAEPGGTGLVFNIQKFSLHDGSGIRTLVFLKGCPLSCRWCSNPEGQSYAIQLAYNESKCIGIEECDRCITACTAGAVRPSVEGIAEIDRERCTDCGDCVEVCPSKALELFGKSMTVDEVLEVVEQDSSFYARSGGGLTLSGGEPLSQTEFSLELLRTAQSRGIDTALETSGQGRWEDLQALCRHANEIFYDIKSMDAQKHKVHAGTGNRLILENFRKLREEFKELRTTVRTPVIPGFNDSRADIEAIVEFLSGIPGSCRYELLAFHRFGESKYKHLGSECPFAELEPPPAEEIAKLRTIIEAAPNLIACGG